MSQTSPRPLKTTPPEAWSPLVSLARTAGRPLERFLHIEAASGILLILAAAIAMAIANSPLAASYAAFWHTPAGLRLGPWSFERSLEWVVNDGLMVIFFFVVGLEIRREVHRGELSEWKRAVVPVAAAVGGMLAPAAIYLLLAGEAATRSGWGVPMATDIAFAVGILTLLGQRVPAALRVLLLALAVIDDLGAIIVIALFYSSGVQLSGFVVAGAGLLAVVAMQRFGVRSKLAYVLPGLVVWGGTYAAGVHPTIAGVVLGFITPVRAWLGTEGFVAGVRAEIDAIERVPPASLSTHDLATKLSHVDEARREALSPAEALIAALHPWVAFVIMPLFALANAGVPLAGGLSGDAAPKVASAVAAGLVLGKPLGILLATQAVVLVGLGRLPTGLTLRHLILLGLVAGIGFTMALFVAQLAFNDAQLLAAAKVGVLSASGAAALIALAVGKLALPDRCDADAAKTADEAEASTEH